MNAQVESWMLTFLYLHDIYTPFLMKVFFLSLLFAFATLSLLAQDDSDSYFNNNLTIDSLKKAISHSKEDTNRVNLYVKLAGQYTWVNPDSNLFYSSKGVTLARKLEFKRGEVAALHVMGEALAVKGNLTKALEVKLEALHKAEKLHDPILLSHAYMFLAPFYGAIGEYRKGLFYLNKTIAHKEFFNRYRKYLLNTSGHLYTGLIRLDSAEYYIRQAYELDRKDTTHFHMIYLAMGELYERKGEYAKALEFYGVFSAMEKYPIIQTASVLNKMGRQDSAIYIAKKILEKIKRLNRHVLEPSRLLTDIYKSQHAYDSAFKYQQLMLAAKDSLFSQEKVKYLQNLTFNEGQRQ